MKYKCLVLDHDDTVVNSTATVHYPAFCAYLRRYHPELSGRWSIEDYLRYNFSPGVVEFFRDIVGLSPEDMDCEEAFWADYVREHIPAPFPGIGEIIADFRTRGGIIAVDSHSYSHYILRDYRAGGLPQPDIVYGWELPPEQRKPSPYTLLDLSRRLSVPPEEILVVDDLKPGYDMARAAGCAFAAAGWAYDIPAISGFMRAHCDIYCETPQQLRAALFTEV